jgi:hypothetical protein
MSTFRGRTVRLVLAFSIAAVVGSVLTSSVPMQGGDIKKDVPLLVTLRTDKSVYLPKERIHLQVLLTNVSSKRLYVPLPLDWGESASLSLWASDSVSKKEVQGSFLADAVTPLPEKREDFVQLLPNHILGVSDQISLEDINLNRPGKYDLYVNYHCPVPAEFNFGLPIWSREQGSIRSNVVTIEVAKSK